MTTYYLSISSILKVENAAAFRGTLLVGIISSFIPHQFPITLLPTTVLQMMLQTTNFSIVTDNPRSHATPLCLQSSRIRRRLCQNNSSFIQPPSCRWSSSHSTSRWKSSSRESNSKFIQNWQVICSKTENTCSVSLPRKPERGPISPQKASSRLSKITIHSLYKSKSNMLLNENFPLTPYRRRQVTKHPIDVLSDALDAAISL